MTRTLTIVSGGQTGVDRGALDAALEAHVPCGGWCPEGRLAEDGRIPDRYPVKELPCAGYEERTRQNIRDSDGTLIVHFGPMSGGTLYTFDRCLIYGRPVHLVDGAILPVETQPELAADPADYGVRADGTITIQAAETIGHYAKWLGVPSKRLRQHNRLRDDQQLVTGRRLKLDFAKVSRASFERQRVAHHQTLQSDFFQRFRIAGLRQHRVEGGDSLWVLAAQRYDVPLWLLRQYNPDIALDTVLSLGGIIAVPVLEQTRAEQPDLHAEKSPEPGRDSG